MMICFFLFQITSVVFAFTVIHCVRSEPPINTQYGTPLAAPISSYGTPNFNANGHDHEYNEVTFAC